MVHSNHKCIFVHITKTAGSSITKCLGGHDIGSPHRDIFKYRSTLPPQIFNNYFKFAFVRNPWDRMVSEYHYQRQRKDGKKTNLSFIEYLKQGHPSQTSNQLKWISTITNNNIKILVDFVGKFENLEEDIKLISKKINYEIILPKINSSEHDNYQKYYTDETKNIVANSHKHDIEYYKYKF